MIMRSHFLRRRARGLIAGVVVVAGLSSAPLGLAPATAQEPTPPAKGAIRKDQTASAKAPEVRLRLQRLRTRRARAAYDVARLDREIAEIAVEEYTLGTYPEELAAVEGEIKVGERERDRAEELFNRAKRMFERGQAPRPLLEELNLRRAKYLLEALEDTRKVLKQYTYERTVRQLEGDVKRARKVEGDREADWRREADRLGELGRQFDRT